MIFDFSKLYAYKMVRDWYLLLGRTLNWKAIYVKILKKGKEKKSVKIFFFSRVKKRKCLDVTCELRGNDDKSFLLKFFNACR